MCYNRSITKTTGENMLTHNYTLKQALAAHHKAKFKERQGYELQYFRDMKRLNPGLTDLEFADKVENEFGEEFASRWDAIQKREQSYKTGGLRNGKDFI